ncbi:hypothetical protein NPIL_632891 [Nephila pilipes]|uniref:Uncharacterized protein n=1 Tax=Nephila pilipes TaxID=299642 RepID=A0A8X6Q369_NEPPI|nr:hypothetical protein NPIL_632891 [Nephila pilipes]
MQNSSPYSSWNVSAALDKPRDIKLSCSAFPVVTKTFSGEPSYMLDINSFNLCTSICMLCLKRAVNTAYGFVCSAELYAAPVIGG